MIRNLYTLKNILLIFMLVILVIQHEYIYSGLKFTVILFSELFSGNNQVRGLLDVELLSNLLIVILFLAAFILLLGSTDVRNFLQQPLTISRISITLLVIIFLFAPLLTNQNPNFQKDLSLTKLKKPFSSQKYLQIDENISDGDNKGSILKIKNELVRITFDESYIYFDSLQVSGESIKVFAKDRVYERQISEFVAYEGTPEISSHFFLLGTDHLGRDIYTQLIYGIRLSVFIAVSAVIIASLIGISLGFIAGYYGGVLDTALSRISDVFLTFPSIFLVLLILAFFGSNFISVIIVLGISGWVSLFRIVKSETLNITHKNYIITSKMLGLSNFNIMFREILPVISSPIIVNLIFLIANVILAEAVLSYLGLGAGIDHISLGRMISAGQEYFDKASWMIIVPSLTLIFILFTFNSFAEKLNLKLNPTTADDKQAI
ncbi:MAG: ABC transporter permease [Melioribacteraceae bacterium]|nr:ABC transporter permease [Melioribacteraceae bacterium]